jgi:hypothetical protein
MQRKSATSVNVSIIVVRRIISRMNDHERGVLIIILFAYTLFL